MKSGSINRLNIFRTVSFNTVSFHTVCLGLALAFAVSNAQAIAVAEAAPTGPIYTGLFSDKAVGGYDPVAYFSDGKPTRGKAEFSYKYGGANWFFESREHLDSFKAQPEKYAPQYGGYCAYAAAKNDLVSADPEAWKIVDGKLYLNYSKDVQKKWEANQADFITKADSNWPALARK